MYHINLPVLVFLCRIHAFAVCTMMHLKVDEQIYSQCYCSWNMWI